MQVAQYHDSSIYTRAKYWFFGHCESKRCHISLGSVATHLRIVGIFNDDLFPDILLSLKFGEHLVKLRGKRIFVF